MMISKMRLVKHCLILSLIINLAFIGVILNLFVVSANGGKMPVYSTWHFSTEEHFSYSDRQEINYFILSDFLHIGNFYYFSIGDVLMLLSMILFVAYDFKFFILDRRKNEKR